MNKVQINAKGAKRVLFGHPWVFKSDLIGTLPKEPQIVSVIDHRGKHIADAFFSPRSQISIRIIQTEAFGGLKPVDDSFWKNKVISACEKRKELAKISNAVRLIHGEADGIPSVIVDKYNDIIVVQSLSAGAETIKETIFKILKDESSPKAIVERNDVTVRKLEGLEEKAGFFFGSNPKTEIFEGTQKFIVDTVEGQKTGAFLDQRSNRLIINQWSKGETLDCFSYQGWFACHMASKAKSVISIDSSELAVEYVDKNATLNGHKNIESLKANVFEYLRDNKDQRFDFIHLDPPAFVKSRTKLVDGIRGYKEINLRAMKMLKPGGYLMTSSCSQHLSREEFIAMLHASAVDAGRNFHIVYQGSQDIDHPILLSFPESEYLKTIVLRMI